MMSFASALFRKKRALRFFCSGAAVPPATRPLAVPAGDFSVRQNRPMAGENFLLESDAVSLTPALSRWERETGIQPRQCRTRSARRTLTDFLPLPAGEGRGEGERNRQPKMPVVPGSQSPLRLSCGMLGLLTPPSAECAPAFHPAFWPTPAARFPTPARRARL